MRISRRRRYTDRLRRHCLRIVATCVSLALVSGNGDFTLLSFGISSRTTAGHYNANIITYRRTAYTRTAVRNDLFKKRTEYKEEGDDSPDTTATLTREALPPPLPPTELPLRFLRAGKNNPEEGMRRYQKTLEWRKNEQIDTILRQPYPQFEVIKLNYPHFYHLKGRNGEPCYYEQPARTNFKALRQAGVSMDQLLRHYIMITEFQWQYLERDDLATSIFVVDIGGIRMTDFVGETVELVRKAAKLSAQHYPERGGYVFVINVPRWFRLIWKAVSPLFDRSTLKKVHVLRGKEEIRKHLLQRIPLENIPPEYGGTSIPLGHAPEEKLLADLMAHNNRLAVEGRKVCSTCTSEDPQEWECQFCRWVPARSY